MANTSHELRTPLNGILGLVDSVVDGVAGPINDRQKQNLQWVISSTHRLTDLVNDILDFSKLITNSDRADRCCWIGRWCLKLRSRPDFEAGVEYYRQTKFQRAQECFLSALAINPTDHVVQVYLERVSFLQQQPPSHPWDGVWHWQQK